MAKRAAGRRSTTANKKANKCHQAMQERATTHRPWTERHRAPIVPSLRGQGTAGAGHNRGEELCVVGSDGLVEDRAQFPAAERTDSRACRAIELVGGPDDLRDPRHVAQRLVDDGGRVQHLLPDCFESESALAGFRPWPGDSAVSVGLLPLNEQDALHK